MTKLGVPVNAASVLFTVSLVLLLAAFVSPYWVDSRHGHDSWGLWQHCEFGACKPLDVTHGWYLAMVAFQTMAFGSAALSVLVLLVYVFATSIPDHKKRYVLIGCMVCAILTIVFITIGVVILGAKHQSLGGQKDIFGNTIRYDLDWCFVVACIAAGGFGCGVVALAVHVRVV